MAGQSYSDKTMYVVLCIAGGCMLLVEGSRTKWTKWTQFWGGGGGA